MPKFTPALCLVLLASLTPTRAASAQSAASLSAEALEFVSVSEPSFALSGVRVVDGTGASPLDDQTIVVADGRSARGPNPGRRWSKVIRGCTICVSCPSTTSASVVQK